MSDKAPSGRLSRFPGGLVVWESADLDRPIVGWMVTDKGLYVEAGRLARNVDGPVTEDDLRREIVWLAGRAWPGCKLALWPIERTVR